MAQVNAGRVRFIGRGEYDNSTQYYTFDLVNYNGNSYFAKSNTMGNLPTNSTYWQLVAEKGNIGPAGPTGNGIDHISLTSQSGATKVYTIYYTDGTTSEYTVQDGEVTQEVFDEEVERLKMVYNAMPKVSGEGTNLTLNNTAECPVYDIELSPSELEQATTTGKNLAPSITFDKQWSLSGNGDTRTITTSTYKKCEVVKVSPNTTYTISGDFSSLDGNVIRIAMFDNEPAVNSVSTKFVFSASPYTFTTQSTTNYILLYNSSNTDTTVNNLQLELGDTATSYEPYTYGASPNPQYPQEIHTVSGDNTVVVGNKNLAKSDWANNFVEKIGDTNKAKILTSEGRKVLYYVASAGYPNYDDNYLFKIPFKENTQYTFLFDMNTTSASDGNISIRYTDGTSSYIPIPINSWQKVVMTSEANKTIKYLMPRYNTGTSNIDLNTFMVYEGTTETTYVPHQEQTYPLSLGDLEYCKIGDYEDLFFKNVVGSEYYDSTLELDKWYLKKNTDKLVLDGSETYYDYNTTYEDYYLGYTTNKHFGNAGVFNTDALCDCFKMTGVNFTPNYSFVASSGYALYIKIKKDVASTKEELKTWLSSHNATIYYRTYTSTDTLLNSTLQTQLDNIQKAISYQDQTNVSQTNDDLPFVLSLSAIEDLSGIFEEI